MLTSSWKQMDAWKDGEEYYLSRLVNLCFTECIEEMKELAAAALYSMEEGDYDKVTQLRANQTLIRMDKSDAWRSVAQDLELLAAKEAVKAMRNLQAIIQCKAQICFGQSTKDNHWSDQREDVRV
ncbi:hypothetical protein Tco_0621099 [Tanacetum coccineum]